MAKREPHRRGGHKHGETKEQKAARLARDADDAQGDKDAPRRRERGAAKDKQATEGQTNRRRWDGS